MQVDLPEVETPHQTISNLWTEAQRSAPSPLLMPWFFARLLESHIKAGGTTGEGAATHPAAWQMPDGSLTRDRQYAENYGGVLLIRSDQLPTAAAESTSKAPTAQQDNVAGPPADPVLVQAVVEWWLDRMPFGQRIDEYLDRPDHWCVREEKPLARLAATLYRQSPDDFALPQR